MSGAKRSRPRRRSASGRRLAWTLGLVAVLAVLWVLTRGWGGAPAPPLDEHDPASRERLEQLLRESERGEER